MAHVLETDAGGGAFDPPGEGAVDEGVAGDEEGGGVAEGGGAAELGPGDGAALVERGAIAGVALGGLAAAVAAQGQA